MISSGNWGIPPAFHQHRDFPEARHCRWASPTGLTARGAATCQRVSSLLAEPRLRSASWKTSICLPQKKSSAEETSHSKLSLLGLRYVEFFLFKGKHINELFLEARCRWTFWIEEPFFEKAWEPNIRGIRCEATQFWAILMWSDPTWTQISILCILWNGRSYI